MCRVCFQKSRNSSKPIQYIFSSTGHAKGKNAHVTKGKVLPIVIPSSEWFWDEMKKQKFYLMCSSGCAPKKHRMGCLRKKMPEWFVPRLGLVLDLLQINFSNIFFNQVDISSISSKHIKTIICVNQFNRVICSKFQTYTERKESSKETTHYKC